MNPTFECSLDQGALSRIFHRHVCCRGTVIKTCKTPTLNTLVPKALTSCKTWTVAWINQAAPVLRFDSLCPRKLHTKIRNHKKKQENSNLLPEISHPEVSLNWQRCTGTTLALTLWLAEFQINNLVQTRDLESESKRLGTWNAQMLDRPDVRLIKVHQRFFTQAYSHKTQSKQINGKLKTVKVDPRKWNPRFETQEAIVDSSNCMTIDNLSS